MIERTYIDAYTRHFKMIKTISLPRIVYHIAFIVLFLIASVILGAWFTPWVQTASGTGFVTTLHPSDRVQNITALVSGRIKKWYVQEGDTVKKGDPLVEIIDNDVNLIDRLLGQRNALKYSHEATTIAAQTAKLNYDRQQNLFASGLVSKLDVEKAHITYKKYLSEQQKAHAKLKQSESKVSQQQAQLLTSSRDGVILSITAGDLSTAVKSGDNIAVLVPNKVAPAVSLYINGIDIALVNAGRKVRLQFEGWPSIQFSGWPSTAIGTFGGVVQSVDPTISENGRFRVLITPDADDAPWPDSRFLHYGARVKGWVLLEKVRLGYELWRQLNAFPPEFSSKPPESYSEKSDEKKKK